MGAPTVYRWDDPNAPVLCGFPNTICDVIKACLVDGYGTGDDRKESPGGWTVSHEQLLAENGSEHPVSLALNAASTKGKSFTVKVETEVGRGGTGSKLYAYIQAGLVVSPTNELLDKFPSSAGRIDVSSRNDSTQRPWLLIADAHAFYFYVWTNSSSGGVPAGTATFYGFFVGQLVGCFDSDLFDIGVAFTRLSTSFTSSLGLAYKNSHITMANNREGTGAATNNILRISGGPAAHVGGGYLGQGGASLIDGEMAYISSFYSQGVGSVVRAFMPGLYVPGHRNNKSNLGQFTFDGLPYLAVSGSSYSGSYWSAVYIALSDWRTP
ncbi:hypothetical protein [Desulfotalea psychrophila]|uniref:Uncharacterized protein n=1 Tax=Desulfotalea psychrophila (strain LSv54 / DSM 12343) TaxID=177439 RepID=Q6AMV1_DESPS|nr:hypothetical protein [Desulfotalea psychrophila]CAG36323.1 unknown protein [Desulfotalea psychrophila LSv54]